MIIIVVLYIYIHCTSHHHGVGFLKKTFQICNSWGKQHHHRILLLRIRHLHLGHLICPGNHWGGHKNHPFKVRLRKELSYGGPWSFCWNESTEHQFLRCQALDYGAGHLRCSITSAILGSLLNPSTWLWIQVWHQSSRARHQHIHSCWFVPCVCFLIWWRYCSSIPSVEMLVG